MRFVSITREIEATPANYPAAPTGLSDAAAAIDPGIIWQRLESWLRVRWSPRSVVWILHESGEFDPPIGPFDIEAVERFELHEWIPAQEIYPGPMGGIVLPRSGPYRVMATVGADNPPDETALEAYRRLAEYLVAGGEHASGMTSMSASVGDVSTRISRDANWTAKAVSASGAFDLLRHLRRRK